MLHGAFAGFNKLGTALAGSSCHKNLCLIHSISTFMKFLSVARLKCSYGQLVFSSPSYSTASIFVTGAPVNLCWTCYDHKVSGFISQDGSAKTVLAILIPGMQLQPLVTNGTNNFGYRSVFFFLYLIQVANLMYAWVLVTLRTELVKPDQHFFVPGLSKQHSQDYFFNNAFFCFRSSLILNEFKNSWFS